MVETILEKLFLRQRNCRTLDHCGMVGAMLADKTQKVNEDHYYI